MFLVFQINFIIKLSGSTTKHDSVFIGGCIKCINSLRTNIFVDDESFDPKLWIYLSNISDILLHFIIFVM